jgi:hypothetical protein
MKKQTTPTVFKRNPMLLRAGLFAVVTPFLVLRLYRIACRRATDIVFVSRQLGLVALMIFLVACVFAFKGGLKTPTIAKVDVAEKHKEPFIEALKEKASSSMKSVRRKSRTLAAALEF